MNDTSKLLKKAGYIFALGLATYLWWKFTSGIKKKIVEEG